MLRVVATTTQIADLARNVGGDLAHVDGILSANVDPGDFELGPGDLQRISWADLVLKNGVGLEDAWLAPLEAGTQIPVVVTDRGVRLLPGNRRSLAAPAPTASAVPVVVTSRGVDVLPASQMNPRGDPRVWSAVPNAVRMVVNIRDAFSAAAPPYASYYYQANSARYIKQLWALDEEILRQISMLPRSRRTLVTTFNTFRYYAARYGLTLVTVKIPGDESPASDQEVSALAGRIREQHVQAIFVDHAVSASVAQRIGREAGVRVVTDLYGETLGLPGSDGDTYLKMMRHDTAVIVAALR
jgi:ABC-type Zn uptake system ZnuABC Zn-binding protein ZnuA